MSDISKRRLFILIYYFLVIISQTVRAINSFQRNETNSSKQFQATEKYLINQTSMENLTILNYYFFSYDIINHKTLLIKFDITHTNFFQQSQILYDAYLYISKIPSINYKINIGPFSGLYEKELDGTINDHFTFCLVLLPNRHQKEFNITLNTNKTETIYREFLTLPYQEQQYIIHYCTKMGPDRDHKHRYGKRGSEGDHVLLLLQIILIGIFLAILQISHIIRDQKYKQWRLRQLHHELLFRKGSVNLPNDALERLLFTTVNNEESQEKTDEKDKEDYLTMSHRRLPSPTTKRRRSRSHSPTIRPLNINTDASSVAHILESKPWLQISQLNTK